MANPLTLRSSTGPMAISIVLYIFSWLSGYTFSALTLSICKVVSITLGFHLLVLLLWPGTLLLLIGLAAFPITLIYHLLTQWLSLKHYNLHYCAIGHTFDILISSIGSLDILMELYCHQLAEWLFLYMQIARKGFAPSPGGILQTIIFL